MRIHASGVGKTIEEALAKPLAELATAALHAHEFERVPDRFMNVEGKPVLDPRKARCANPHRAVLEEALRNIAALVPLASGHNYRILVSLSDDGADAHARIDVDLIKD